MTQTTTVIVPPADHHRASMYVDRALAGNGSLNGFFDFIGQAGVRLVKRAPAITDSRTAMGGPFAALKSVTDQDAFAPRDRYLPRWKEAWEELGWYREDLPEVHLLALYFLRDIPAAWEMVPLWRNRAHENAPTDLLASMQRRYARADVDSALATYARKARERSVSQREVARARFVPDGILLEWSHDAPQPVEVSIDPDAKAKLERAFGRGVFARIENALIRMFEDPTYLLDVWREGEALERGEMPDTKPSIVREKLHKAMDDMDPTRARNTGGGLPGGGHDESWLTEIEYVRGERRSEWFSRLVPGLGFHPQFAEATHPFWERMESHHEARAEVAWLFLARELGLVRTLLDLEQVDDDVDLRAEFEKRYRLDRVTPSRDALHAVVSRKAMPEEPAGDVPTAVDFHVVELFRLYVNQVTGGRDATWSHRATWTTLAQPDVFPMTTVLEAWSGVRAARGADGNWVLGSDGQDVLSLEHDQAISVVDALRTCVPIQSTLSHETDIAGLLLVLPEEVRTDNPLIRSSPDLLRDVLASAGHHGDRWDHAVSILERAIVESCVWGRKRRRRITADR